MNVKPLLPARPIICALAFVVAAALSVLPTPGYAQTTALSDARNDAPDRIDITSTAYSHTARRLSARVVVPDLGPSGRTALYVSRYDTLDPGYGAIVRRSTEGRLTIRFYYYSHVGLERRRCAGMTGSWDTAGGEVRVSLPRRCMDEQLRRHLHMRAVTIRGEQFDTAPAVHLRRG